MNFGHGIIPARAGFTGFRSSFFTVLWDHPRSRGVYENKTGHPTPKPGSSPLARGLHPSQAHEPTGLRIIPARAGFTVVSMQPDTACQDHPRSRGVYPILRLPERYQPGSSPLARGLLRIVVGLHKTDGIIPARAGFTRSHKRVCPMFRDHPRSRGVYIFAHGDPEVSVGSSPLARGLLRIVVGLHKTDGIIPARAGFTPHVAGRAPDHGDHPRSRGVYFLPFKSLTIFSGSSPLARGLRPLRTCPGNWWRIIPARAGFTLPSMILRRCSADHPRSRGVYQHYQENPSFLPGSSPLARGLHQVLGASTSRHRIIPARAGFTQ